MKDMTNIPIDIFDLIGRKDFASLNAREREQVLASMTADEYAMLHNAASASMLSDTDMPSPDDEIGVRLMTQFERKHKVVALKPSVFEYSVRLWKVAAVFVLLAGGTAWAILQAGGRKEVTYITVKDTVYVPSLADASREVVKVHDTVYLGVDENNVPVKRTARIRREVIAGDTHHAPRYSAIPPSDIHLLSIREKDALPNRPKGNSQKDDTLLRQFGFVRL